MSGALAEPYLYFFFHFTSMMPINMLLFVLNRFVALQGRPLFLRNSDVSSVAGDRTKQGGQEGIQLSLSRNINCVPSQTLTWSSGICHSPSAVRKGTWRLMNIPVRAF